MGIKCLDESPAEGCVHYHTRQCRGNQDSPNQNRLVFLGPDRAPILQRTYYRHVIEQSVYGKSCIMNAGVRYPAG